MPPGGARRGLERARVGAEASCKLQGPASPAMTCLLLLMVHKDHALLTYTYAAPALYRRRTSS